MQRASKFVRQIFSAALLLSPFSALAETKARFDAALGAIIVSGMVSKDTSLLLNDPSLIRLQNAARPEASGMLVALEEVNGEVQIKPRFSLQTSTRYAFSINWPNAAPFSTEFTLNAVAAAAPDLEDVAGNTIRAAFDATAGIIGSTVPEASIYVHID